MNAEITILEVRSKFPVPMTTVMLVFVSTNPLSLVQRGRCCSRVGIPGTRHS